MDAVQRSDALPDAAALRQAYGQARSQGRSASSALTDLAAPGAGDARAMVRQAGALMGLAVVETAYLFSCTPALALLPLSAALRRHCVVVHAPDTGGLQAVVADPFDADLMAWLQSLAQAPLVFALALQEDIVAYLVKLEEGARATDGLGHVPDDTAASDAQRDKRAVSSLSLSALGESASPAVKLVNSILYDALKSGASDIHIESTATGMSVKFRIDGVLDPALTVQGVELAEYVISRLKVVAELDISERRVPQDGSFMVSDAERDIDLRLSIMPSIHGEDAVIRVLDKRAMIETYGALSLDALGFDAASLSVLRRLAQEPYGMLLVTGPTGSGKTTTLYGALTEIHDGRSKIITIEDPVEYQLPGVLQIPVNEKKGLTFAKGLRSILRHDPDKIMVGEIRDNETAEIAVQSALTGHLVLTTVHANNVFDVLGRFVHMGIDPYSFVSALNGIWAQRLLRVICPHCSVAHTPSVQECESAGLTHSDSAAIWKVGRGCGDCRGTGYKGRRAIAEILLLNDELRELIIEKAPIRKIKETAHRQGTRSLRDAALALARRGETTLAEVNRVTLNA
ncbi:MAG: GspE/PulE family protein [Rhodoferax sp.]|nr:GspE/PulE family protein [Rhodoferax sp.]